MKLKKKLLHFFYAIRDSLASLAIGLLLLVAVVICLHAFPTSNSNQEVSFLLGIVASVIATLILRVSERYSNSCSAVFAILGEVENVATYVQTVVVNKSRLDAHKFELWQMYANICDESRALSYKGGFPEISEKVSKVVEAVYCGRDEFLDEAINQLREAASFWMQ